MPPWAAPTPDHFLPLVYVLAQGKRRTRHLPV